MLIENHVMLRTVSSVFCVQVFCCRVPVLLLISVLVSDSTILSDTGFQTFGSRFMAASSRLIGAAVILSYLLA